eukprot:scaffold34989_cov118-Isochrysis_galbana.AAC.2
MLPDRVAVASLQARNVDLGDPGEEADVALYHALLRYAEHELHLLVFADEGDEEDAKDGRHEGGRDAHLDPGHGDGGDDERKERQAVGDEDSLPLLHQHRHRALDRARRALQREAVPVHGRKARDAHRVQRERHGERGRAVEDRLHPAEFHLPSAARANFLPHVLRDLQFHQRIKRKACDDRSLRGDVGVALHIVL